ncbi:MAG: MFS transporter, partial [Alphaproteobacteria bacterium]|nr:MFS transporter [Alphaproteobacteria bacterium]
MANVLRAFTIALTAFLTVVDLFATQAILPPLATAYGVTPAAMGFAVNATTIGMAVGGLAVSILGRRIDRRRGILVSLVVLTMPTALLATMPSLPIFTALRIAQGLCMSTAFALTLAWLGEHTSAADSAGAFAAYITGNVASNLFGRLLAAGVVDHLGLSANFAVFAALNFSGAVLVWFTIERTPVMREVDMLRVSPWRSWLTQLANPALRAAFAIGFLILFVFIGIYSYVNFVLVRAPFDVGMMMLGMVYFVFLPSIV